jgi:small-conductance mechanosensitive channel
LRALQSLWHVSAALGVALCAALWSTPAQAQPGAPAPSAAALPEEAAALSEEFGPPPPPDIRSTSVAGQPATAAADGSSVSTGGGPTAPELPAEPQVPEPAPPAEGITAPLIPPPPPRAEPRAPALPVASVAAAPSSSGSQLPAFSVKLGDYAVMAVRGPHRGKAPEMRAREASDALKRAYQTETTSDVAIARRAGLATLSVGRTPIIELTEEDAELSGASSLDVHAANVASSIHQTLVSERKRSAIAKSAFSFSLVVFFGLIAFYLIRKLGEFAERARTYIDSRSDRDLSIRFQNIEFVRPAMLRSTGVLALGTLKWLAQFGVAYTWLVVVLSLFDSTRGYTQKLTGFVVAPLSQLMERLATALPLLVVAALAALAVFVLVRFVGLIFVSVSGGETPLGWLPSHWAGPTSVLLRAAIVLAALVFLAPIVTGDSDGALSRVGAIGLIALGLAATPILSSATIGAITLYGRRLRPGEYVEFGAYRGRVAELNLLELRLTVTDRTELRVPHLLTLVRPLRVLGARPRLTLDVYVSSGSSVTEVRSLLATVAGKVGSEPSVEIVAADADAIRFRVAATCESLEARTAFHIAALDALSSAGITLGRDRA